MSSITLFISFAFVTQAAPSLRAPQSSAHPRRLLFGPQGPQPFGPLHRFMSGYAKALKKQPLLTNVATGAALACLSDTVCQTQLEQHTRMDWKRLRALTTWGAFYDGAGNHFLAKVYAGVVYNWFRLCKLRQVIAYAALANFVVSPLVYVPAYHVATRVLQGDNIDEAFQKMQDKWWPSLRSSWNVWIPLQAMNFGVVPQHLRVATVNAANLVWNVMMDDLAHSSPVAETEAVSATPAVTRAAESSAVPQAVGARAVTAVPLAESAKTESAATMAAALALVAAATEAQSRRPGARLR